MNLAAAAAALLASACPVLAAPPQSWEPFTPRREVSPRGTHYVVLRNAEDRTGVTFELVRRREGAPPILPARAAGAAPGPGETGADIGRDPADALLAEGRFARPPFQVRVLDGRAGAVLFETYGAPGSGDALSLLGVDGRPAWRLATADLLEPAERASLPRNGDDLWWFQAWWVDEERDRIVIVLANDRFLEVEIGTGAVSPADAEVVATRLGAGPGEDRLDAWDLALRLKVPNLLPVARWAAASVAEPPAIRLRAALLAFRAERKGPAPDLFRAAAPRTVPSAARTFALRWMGEVLGEDALPLLRDALRGEADDGWRPALAALADVGDAAVPALVAMLGEKDQSLDYRGGAAHALGALRSPGALSALWEAAAAFDPAGDEFHFVPGAALDALLECAPADLRARLLALLAKGTPHDGRIAGWLARNPGADAVPALLDALDRSGRFAWERKPLLAALRACTGKDLGDDLVKWREGVR